MPTGNFFDVVAFVTELSGYTADGTTDTVIHQTEIIRSVGESGAHDVMSTQIDIEQYFPLQTKIPASHQIAITCSFVILTVFLNSLVLKHYFRLKEITRPYILALVGFDFVSVFFGLIPFTILNFVTHDVHVFHAFFAICMTSLSFTFGLYLYPSLFLAVDRFVVVLFPLKFRELTGKVRCFKAVLFAIQFLISIGDSYTMLVYGLHSVPSLFLKSMSIFINIIVLLALTIMYTTMVVMIIKTSRQMATSRQQGNAKNR